MCTNLSRCSRYFPSSGSLVRECNNIGDQNWVCRSEVGRATWIFLISLAKNGTTRTVRALYKGSNEECRNIVTNPNLKSSKASLCLNKVKCLPGRKWSIISFKFAIQEGYKRKLRPALHYTQLMYCVKSLGHAWVVEESQQSFHKLLAAYNSKRS